MKAKGVLLEYNPASGVLKCQLMTESRKEMTYHFEKNKKAVHQFDIAKWYKKKTTGPNSLNNHVHGHSRQIADEMGEDVRWVRREACIKTPGFPTKLNKFGKVQPKKWEDVTTIEAGGVVETLHRMAAFLGIELIEKKWGESGNKEVS